MTIIEKIEEKGYRIEGNKIIGYKILKYSESDKCYLFDGFCQTKKELKDTFL